MKLNTKHTPARLWLPVPQDALDYQRVVDLDGPPDLKAILDAQKQICGSPVVTDLLGGSPDDRPTRYHDASPIELLPIGVKQEIFAGRMFGSVVPAYESAAKRAGDSLHATVIADAGHFVFINPQSSVWPQVLQSVRQLLGLKN